MRIPNLTGALVVTAKFTYRQIVLLVLLSVAFWLVSAFVVTIGAAMIAMFRTVRKVPEENRSDLGFLAEFVREVPRNVATGLPLTALVVGVPLATALYLSIGLAQRSQYFVLAGLLGIYITLIALLLAFRTANVLSFEEGGVRAAVVRAIDVSSAHPHFSVLHACLVVGVLAVSVVLPAFVVLLFPGFVVVLEILLYEEASDSKDSPIRRYLSTLG